MNKKSASNDPSDWGRYAPPAGSIILRALTYAGLGRGRIRVSIIKLWRKHFGNIFDVSVRGIKYRLNISDNVTDEKILTSSKVYDKEELQTLLQACSDSVFIDVGANIGYYSLFIARHGQGRVVAIEPNPPTLERLRFNIAVNDWEEKITIVPLGLGPAGEADLFSRGDLGSASLHDELDNEAGSVTTIKTTSLLNILNELDIQRIGGLKIDIEGMEDQALAPFFHSAPRSLWPNCIVIEHGHEHLWKTDLYQLFEEIGYKIKHHTQNNKIFYIK